MFQATLTVTRLQAHGENAGGETFEGASAAGGDSAGTTQEAAPEGGAKDAGPGGSCAPGAESLSSKERDLSAKLADTHDRMLRIAAEFDNARKRWDKERAEVRVYAITEFARDLLPVIDAFDNAMNAIEQAGIAPDTEEGKRMGSIVEGVRMVSKVFTDSLRKHGVERIPAKGAPFNPMHHNAVARTVDASLKQDTVVDEFQAGYKIADRVLRTAMVRVATPD